MEDRIPTPGQEGRVLITPEDGSAPYYATVEMADNPTNPGTPLNKENLLQDSTEVEIFGNAGNRTVDEALSGLMGKIALIMQNVASMTLTVTDTAGTPLQGVYVSGIFDEDGNAVATNASGQITGYVAEGTTLLSVSGYGDIEDWEESFDAVKGQSYTKAIQLTTRNFLQITSTRNIRFSGNVQQLDINPVGGGGGAGYSYTGFLGVSSGGAGGGGYCVVQNDVSFQENQMYSAVVGSGGGISSAGGTSSLLGVSAAGGSPGTAGQVQIAGKGGTGNGNGANGVNIYNSNNQAKNGNSGSPGIVQGFASFTEMILYGGGGGSGGAATGSSSLKGNGGTGGNPFGGNGGNAYGSSAEDGQSGSGFGGGGGSGGSGVNDNDNSVGRSGSGYQGCINVRMHLKSAA